MNTKIKAGIAALLAGGLLTAGGVAMAEGNAPAPNPGVQGQVAPPAGKAGKAGKAGHLGNPLKRVVRGDMVVMGPDGKPLSIHIERGTVGDIADGSFSVTGGDGTKVTVKTDTATVVKPKSTQLADLNGKVATVISDHKDGDTWVAKLVASGEKKDKGAQSGAQPGQAPQGTTPADPTN